MSAKSYTTIKSLEKTLKILEAFSRENTSLNLTQISTITGIPKTTALNLINTLLENKYIRIIPNTLNYQLGYKSLSLGYNAKMAIPITQFAIPWLEKLQIETGQIVYLTTTVDGYTLYLEGAFPPKRMVNYSVTGKLLPMHCNACGKAMMAYMSEEQIKKIVTDIGLPQFTPNTISNEEALSSELAEIKANGYAFDKEERRVGTTCIGVPIFDSSGKAVAAISISGPTVAMSTAKMLEMLPEIYDVTAFLGRNAAEFPAEFL